MRLRSASAPSASPLGLMQLRIVLCALLWDAERVVCFADGDEAGRCAGVVRVVVWVILFGERVELAFYFGESGSWGEVEGCVMVWRVIVAEGGGGVEEGVS